MVGELSEFAVKDETGRGECGGVGVGVMGVDRAGQCRGYNYDTIMGPCAIS